MFNFYQVCKYIEEHCRKSEHIRLKLKNGEKWNNCEYDKDFGHSHGYFKTFGQLFYIMPRLTKAKFTVIRNDYEVVVHEL